MTNDWLYTKERLELREKVLALLLKRFGSSPVPTNNKAIYECAHDWVSQGNQNTTGVIAYYQAYYS